MSLDLIVELSPIGIGLFEPGEQRGSLLVVTFFMALKNDNPVNALILSIGVIFVTIFLVFILFDTVYRGDLSNTSEKTISEEEGINLNDVYREEHGSSDSADH